MRPALLFPMLLLAGIGVWLWTRDGGTAPADAGFTGVERTVVGGAATGAAPVTANGGAASAARSAALDHNDAGLRSLEAGDPQAAARSFEAALALLPDDPVLARNLSRARLDAGAAAYREGRMADAGEWFARAAEAHPDDGAPAWWQARLLLQQGRRAAAAEALDEALAAFPESAALLRLRADLAWLAGDLDIALADLAAARALLPEDEALKKRVQQLEEEQRAFASFLTDSTAHFDCRYDPADTRLVEAMPELRSDFEDAYHDVVEALGIRPEQRLLVIFLDPERYGGAAPAWSSGLYDGRVRVLVRDPESQRAALQATLRHELTHAMLYTLGAGIPTWLHEGLAQQLEGVDPVHARARLRASGLSLAAAALVQDWTEWSDRGRVAEAYAYALAFCAWLPERYGSGAVQNLLLALPGRGFDEAWQVAFGLPWEQVEAEHRAALLAGE